jgi:very-short-patch-repair endonuclease
MTYEDDQRRTQWLEGQGFRVMRFWNHEVIGNLEGVVQTIEIELNKAASPSS